MAVTARFPVLAVKDSTVGFSGVFGQNREVVVVVNADGSGKLASVRFEFPYLVDIRNLDQAVPRSAEFVTYLNETVAMNKVAEDLAARKGDGEAFTVFAAQHLALARAITEHGGPLQKSLFVASGLQTNKLLPLFEKRISMSSKNSVVYKSKKDAQAYRGVPFDLMLFADHIDTFIDCVEPYNVAERVFINIIHWRDPVLTGGIAFLLLTIAWLDVIGLLPSLLAVLLAVLVTKMGDVTSLQNQLIVQDPGKKKATTGGLGFLNTIQEKFDQAKTIHNGLQTTQNKLFKYNVRMLKVHSLFNGTDKELTDLFVKALAGLAAVLLVVPLRLAFTAGVIYLFTWKFRSRDPSPLERKFDSYYDRIPPRNPVNARIKPSKEKESSKSE